MFAHARPPPRTKPSRGTRGQPASTYNVRTPFVNVIRCPTIVDAPPCTLGNISQLCVANDVQNTVTHEFGHVLGLDHSPDPTSTMYFSEPLGETSKRNLDPGSKRFVCEVYPAALASQDCLLSDGGTDPGGAGGGNPGGGGGGPTGPGIPTGTSGCTAGPGAAGGLGLLALVLLPLLAFRRVR